MSLSAKPSTAMGGLAACLLLLLSFGTLVSVALRADAPSGLSASDWAAVTFTIKQALLSAFLSCVLAIPVARALARRSFAGRRAMIALLGAPFILPVIVAVLGLLAVFGRSGLFSTLLAPLGIGPLDIYGLRGVVLAHVFFNLPLATRLILQGWQAIPAEHFRLAAQLDMTSGTISKHLELPMLRTVLPGAFAIIFLLATTSFAVALALGGGPRATTIELAIYQAFRFDFDLAKAALLALVQFALCTAAATAAWMLAAPAGFGGGLDRPVQRWDANTRAARSLDAGILLLVAVFLFLPLVAIIAKGAPHLLALPQQVIPAAFRSIAVALVSTALTLGLALPLALWITNLKSRSPRLGGAVESIGYLSIATSPMVIGTGLFVLLFLLIDPVSIALPLTAIVNAAVSLPFALRALIPATAQVQQTYGPLCRSLNMSGHWQFRLIIWPRIRHPAGFAAGIAAALSMGDLGVIALFADPDHATLPLVMYRLMAAYNTDAAAAAALLLLCLSLGLFWLFDRGDRVDAEA